MRRLRSRAIVKLIPPAARSATSAMTSISVLPLLALLEASAVLSSDTAVLTAATAVVS